MLVLFLALAAAFAEGVAYVLQQEAAREAPKEHRRSPIRLLGSLLRQRRWLAGVVWMVAGQVLGAAAIGDGNLVYVEPLLSSALLFALVLAARRHRRWLGRTEFAGAVLLSAGVAGFVLVTNPAGVHVVSPTASNWLFAVVVIAALVGVVMALGRRTWASAATTATLWGGAAGILYGLQDVLTRQSIVDSEHLGMTLLTTWPPYALVGVAILGLMINQSAFSMAPLRASLPAVVIAEPIVGMALSTAIYGGGMSFAPLALVSEASSMVAMVVGLGLVSRSNLVTGHHLQHAAREVVHEIERDERAMAVRIQHALHRTGAAVQRSALRILGRWSRSSG